MYYLFKHRDDVSITEIFIFATASIPKVVDYVQHLG